MLVTGPRPVPRNSVMPPRIIKPRAEKLKIRLTHWRAAMTAKGTRLDDAQQGGRKLRVVNLSLATRPCPTIAGWQQAFVEVG